MSSPSPAGVSASPQVSHDVVPTPRQDASVSPVAAPEPASSAVQKPPEVALLGGGCFWCTEAVFLRVRGVQSVQSGYAGGHTPKPDYPSVCSGETGHAEVIRIAFDPQQISFRTLLLIFFGTHDPTTLNRQGHDVGTQYRSVVFAQDDEQAATFRAVCSELATAGTFDAPIVTELAGAVAFHPAEPMHDDYYTRHPAQPYCVAVIGPKMSKLRQKYAGWLREPA